MMVLDGTLHKTYEKMGLLGNVSQNLIEFNFYYGLSTRFTTLYMKC